MATLVRGRYVLGEKGKREDVMALPTCKITRDPALHTCPPMTCQPGKMDDNTTVAPGTATLWDKESGLS